MNRGLVSTIIPVYNRPVQLREAVASVLLRCQPRPERQVRLASNCHC